MHTCTLFDLSMHLNELERCSEIQFPSSERSSALLSRYRSHWHGDLRSAVQ